MLLDNLAMTTRSRIGLRSSSTRCLNPRVGDKQFVRRIYLDIIGRIPNCNEGNRRSGCDGHRQPHVEAFPRVRREKTISKESTLAVSLPKIGKKGRFSLMRWIGGALPSVNTHLTVSVFFWTHHVRESPHPLSAFLTVNL
jgi:hypothetical protein